MAQPVEVQLSYCAELVRSVAPARYLATLFAPAGAREALFALYAFDHEIGKVRQVVSQPMAGLIRLQWWRDALAAIEADRPPAHPVADALQAPLRNAACRPRLEMAIEAREQELEAPPPADPSAFEQQLEGRSAAVVQAALVVLGASDIAALEVGRKVGLAIGLADLLRDLESDLREGRQPLPGAALAAHGIDPQAAADAGERLAPLIARLAGRGLGHLEAARAERRAVPRRALAALLPGSLAGAYLGRLRRAGSTAAARPRSALAPLGLLGRHLVGRF